MHRFTQTISIAGINPYVTVPMKISKSFGKKGFIPIKMKANGHPFLANLVPVGAGRHRLYLHGVMRKKAKAQAGDRITIELVHDPRPRVEPLFKPLGKVLKTSVLALRNWKNLNPSRRKEVNRYLNRLKSDEAVKRNLVRVMKYLEGRGDWFKSKV